MVKIRTKEVRASEALISSTKHYLKTMLENYSESRFINCQSFQKSLFSKIEFHGGVDWLSTQLCVEEHFQCQKGNRKGVKMDNWKLSTSHNLEG
jgi:hypothetical protein